MFYIPCLYYKKNKYINLLTDLYNKLELSKINYELDIYSNYVIEITILNKKNKQNISNIKLLNDSIIFLKKNGRLDLCLSMYNILISIYDELLNIQSIINNDYMFEYGKIYENISEIYYEMELWQNSIDNLLKSKYYYDKYGSIRLKNRVNFKIALIKIVEEKYLEAIFLFEDLIFKNNYYIDNSYLKDSINFSLICYICLIDFRNDYHIQSIHFRKKVEEYRNFLKTYCETYDYLFILNILSSIENKNLNHLHYEISQFFENVTYSNLTNIYKLLFRTIQIQIKCI